MFVNGTIFKVKGSTFENEDKQDIQEEIKQLLNEYKETETIDKNELYGGYTNEEIKEMDLNVSEFEDIEFGGKIVESQYNGELCYKVYISKIYGKNAFEFWNIRDINNADENYLHIGYVPKEEIEEVKEILEQENAVKYNVTIKVLGGKYKQSYLDDSYEEKIKTKTLTYGFECNIYTDDGKEKIKDESTEIKDDPLTIEQSKRKEEREKQKINSRIGLIVYIGLLILSFKIMPFGIITLLISILGIIVCLLTAF